jgi:hypothetical protein
MKQIIACEVMKRELSLLAPEGYKLSFLPASSHLTPEKMSDDIQKEIDKVDSGEEPIILGYGLCSYGITKIKARNRPILIPTIHDCIALLLGSRQRYLEEFFKKPGAYYLSYGWIFYGKTPHSQYHEIYLKKYGEKEARWIVQEMLKNYERLVFIDNELFSSEEGKEKAMLMADFFNLKFSELKAPSTFLKQIFNAEEGENFLQINPGESFPYNRYLSSLLPPIDEYQGEDIGASGGGKS